ncbi:MAG: YbaB/EbfC family nucleoid-associated protein [Candidatus Obscuribacterales bacterium]|nr:YbaB/EbfC family nucleoid-associated protein [Cyanobacteria bacterium SZAS LIN-5]RTL42609.1 MAG: YbaB/EbfC family nucleoid-associated protein [Candidatus Melainabacteria bacterium]
MTNFSNENPLPRMHQLLLKIRRELDAIKVEGVSGDGAVRIVLSGGTRFESVKIDPSLVSEANKEQLEQLLLEATQDAVKQVLLEVKLKTDALRQEFGFQ